MDYKALWEKYQKHIIIGIIAFGAGILAVTAVVASGKPILIDPPKSTKSSFVTLKGKAAPQIGVAVFDKDGRSVLISQTNDKGEFTLSNLPINEGKNKYYIRAIKNNWRASLATVVTIEKDTTAPILEITKLENSSVTGANTVIAGKTESGATVTVNGVKVSVNADGTWTTTVSLQSGVNKITVAATDAAGNTTTDTQTVKYTPSATGSQTGTANTVSSTVTYSAGSLPATASSSNLGPYFLDQNNPTGTIPVDSLPQTSNSGKTDVPSDIVRGIVTEAWVSNPTPNDRATETIYATVKDNYGRTVTKATVTAAAHYKNGVVYYTLKHTGSGQYSTSFKINDKFTSWYKVSVEVTAKYSGYTSTDETMFTMQSLTRS